MPRKKTPSPETAPPSAVPSTGRDTLHVEGDLTIYRVAEARESWLRWLMASSGDGILDLMRVSDCDSAGVQLLLAARLSLAERGEALALRNVSNPVREALQAYGLGTDPAAWPQGAAA